MTARFDTIAQAEAFIAEHKKAGILVTHTSWTDGTRRKGPVLVGLRYAHDRFSTPDLTIEQAIAAVPPAPVEKQSEATKRALKGVAARSANRATPRYVEVLAMLRNGPTSIDDLMAKYNCTPAAASSLFSDVKNKCGATLTRDGRTYRLA